MNNWTSNKKTLILIAALILVLLAIIAVDFIKEKPRFPGDAISPLFKSKIGETTDKELSSQPNLLEKTETNGRTVYTFQPTSNLTGNQIITEGGKAVFEDGTMLGPQSALPLFSDYTSKYGKSEAEFTGSKTYGKFEKTYVWASLGFALKVNPFTEEVHHIQKFAPIPVDEYLKKWGNDISSDIETKEKF